MSNTSTASPVAGIAVGPVLAAAAIVSFLTQLTDEEATACARNRQARAREGLGVTSITLHAKQIEPLVQTAERLGFTRERLSGPGQSVLLSGPAGERLALGREASGRVVLHGADPAAVKRLLRRHTADRVADHLRAKRASVQVATLKGGDVHLEAREADVGQRDGQARLVAHVRSDGRCTVDVSGIRGTRCSEIVEELAEAADCRVTSGLTKDEAFELPGEPTVVRRRV